MGRGSHSYHHRPVANPNATTPPAAPLDEKTLSPTNDSDLDLHPVDRPSLDVQDGVKKVEAVTLTWTTPELIVAYAL